MFLLNRLFAAYLLFCGPLFLGWENLSYAKEILTSYTKSNTVPSNFLLKLDVHLSFYGLGPQIPGEFEWQLDDNKYTLRLETLPAPNMRRELKIVRQSQGKLHKGLLMPEQYIEQHGKKAPVTAHFTYASHGDANSSTISFSRIKDKISLPNGVQDQLSIFMQLSALLRMHPEWLHSSGKTFEIPVASTRDIQSYFFNLVGEVVITNQQGVHHCWHIRSQPLEDRYATQIEAWLEPEANFLPLKIRLSSNDGISIEMLTQQIIRH